MSTTTIRIAIRNLPAHLDRSRIGAILDEIEMMLADDAGVYASVTADSMTIQIEVQTHQLVDTANTLAEAKLI